MITFMKGEYPYGEKRILSQLPNLTLKNFGQLSFVDPKNIKEEEKQEAKRALEVAGEMIRGGKYDLVVLDEVNVAAAWGLVDSEEVAKLIKQKPPHVDLILTGRYAPQRFVELADLVTEMVEVKHPYQKGMSGRKGLDY
jgi:cob(I)alamin adenosyltransferase